MTWLRAVLLLTAFLVTLLKAQGAHGIALTWLDATNPPGTTYSVWRSNGLCSGTPVFAKIATGVTVKTYLDTPLAPGNYCYTATATFNGMESAQAVSVVQAILPDAPTGLVATPK